MVVWQSPWCECYFQTMSINCMWRMSAPPRTKDQSSAWELLLLRKGIIFSSSHTKMLLQIVKGVNWKKRERERQEAKVESKVIGKIVVQLERWSKGILPDALFQTRAIFPTCWTSLMSIKSFLLDKPTRLVTFDTVIPAVCIPCRFAVPNSVGLRMHGVRVLRFSLLGCLSVMYTLLSSGWREGICHWLFRRHRFSRAQGTLYPWGEGSRLGCKESKQPLQRSTRSRCSDRLEVINPVSRGWFQKWRISCRCKRTYQRQMEQLQRSLQTSWGANRWNRDTILACPNSLWETWVKCGWKKVRKKLYTPGDGDFDWTIGIDLTIRSYRTQNWGACLHSTSKTQGTSFQLKRTLD